MKAKNASTSNLLDKEKAKEDKNKLKPASTINQKLDVGTNTENAYTSNIEDTNTKVKTKNSKNKTDNEETPETSNRLLPNLYNKFVSSFENALNDLVSSEGELPRPKLSSLDLMGIAAYIREDLPKNIIFMVGAGISTSAGIPDFRTPGTGLYDNLSKFNLPNPQAIFDLTFFKSNPEPFFLLARDLYRDEYKPTAAHFFIRLIAEKGMLRRCYTQNIDNLEFLAGIKDDKIVAAHGSNHTSTCLNCKKKYDHQWIIERIKSNYTNNINLVPKCDKHDCKGLVKPDIVFFGESLPARFYSSTLIDFPKCDLLIIMGTSLVVQPFASLITQVPIETPRLLINMTTAGTFDLAYENTNNTRDVFLAGECDAGVSKLAKLLGWELELDALIKKHKL